MCTVISGDCGCSKSSSSGVSLEGIAVAISLTAAVSLTYQVFATNPYFFLFGLYPASVAVATRRGRRVLLWLARRVLWVGAGGVMLWRWSRRRRTVVSTAVAATPARAWRVTVYEPTGGTNRVLTRGVVEGDWATPTPVEAETIARAVAQFGYAEAGQLRAHAQLVPQ